MGGRGLDGRSYSEQTLNSTLPLSILRIWTFQVAALHSNKRSYLSLILGLKHEARRQCPGADIFNSVFLMDEFHVGRAANRAVSAFEPKHILSSWRLQLGVIGKIFLFFLE